MDFATVANLLLFSGAIGASFLLDSGNSSSTDAAESDPLYNDNDYARTDLGTDTADAVAADRDMLAWFLRGGNDTLTGSSGADFADLGAGDDQAQLGAGNDIVRGGTGEDQIAGGTGNDLILGEDGHDTLIGNLGDDNLQGLYGDDVVLGGTGADQVSGGAGDDRISGFSASAGSAAGLGSDGADQLFGGDGQDDLLLGRGDIATGGAGQDAFTFDTRWSDSGQFRITDFSASDDSIEILYVPQYDAETSLEIPPTLEIQDTPDGESALILLDGVAVGQVDGAAGLDAARIVLTPDHDTDPGYEPALYQNTAAGTAGDDRFPAPDDATAWFGGDGADEVTGSAEDDYARLGAGDDEAALAGGDDDAWGEAGDDDLAGGAGDDALMGGAGHDTLAGDAGEDALHGDAGDDVILGGAGADLAFGGGGADVLSGFERGAAGDGTMSGIDGADTLFGGEGEDQLILGPGDTATGGDDNDTFVIDERWDSEGEIARITDFVGGSDVLELLYTPAFDSSGIEIPPLVTLVPMTGSTMIVVDAQPVALLAGNLDVRLSDITLIAA